MSPCNICKQKGADLPIWDDIFFPTFSGANPPTHPEKKKRRSEKHISLSDWIISPSSSEHDRIIYMKQSPKGAILSIQTSQ